MRTSVTLASLLLAAMACNSDPDTSDPNDTNDTNDTVADTYDCGWAANDPGTLVAGDQGNRTKRTGCKVIQPV